MSFTDYADYDGLGLGELVRNKAVTPAELLEAAIERAERHNPTLNAIIYKFYDEAQAHAAKPEAAGDGPFAGVPFLLKDILGDYKGVPTTQGTRFMAENVAAHDATLVTRYKQAGVIPFAKTNAPEYGLLPTTEPALYGASRNPWNTDHSTGGSSGGSAAAVAAGVVPLAHANDGGGSIRIPAACCGLVGMKPTRARNPLGPDIGDVMGGLVCEHVVSRTVRDSAAMLDCTAGPEPGDPYWAPPPERPFLAEVGRDPGKLRIAFSTKNLAGEPLHPDCVIAVEETAKLLEELGHTVEEAAPPVDPSVIGEQFMGIWASGLAMLIDTYGAITGRAPTEDKFEPLTWGLYQAGKEITAAQYQMAWALLQMTARSVAAWHETYDCWLTTTLGAPPLKLGTIDINEPDPQKAFEPVLDYVPFTPLQNATGQPSLSLPLHWTADGLPVGVLFTGRFGEEGLLYRLAGQLEKARPWADRKPPLWD